MASEKKFTDKSIGSKGLTICLLTIVIPLLALIYVFTRYGSLPSFITWPILIILICCSVLIIAGYFIAKRIVLALSCLAAESKTIAQGDYEHSIAPYNEGCEFQVIAESVNAMTARMRQYVAELSEYGEKTSALDKEIKKKLSALSSLMKSGEMMASRAGLVDIMDVIVRGILAEIDGGFAAVYLKDDEGNYVLRSFDKVPEEVFSPEDLTRKLHYIEGLLKNREYVKVDAGEADEGWLKKLKAELKTINVVFFPVFSTKYMAGVVVAGRSVEGVEFDEALIAMMKVFSTQINLAFRSAETYDKVRQLETVDALSGVYSPNYMSDRMNDEISRAVFFQRPCSLIIINADDTLGRLMSLGNNERAVLSKVIAEFLSGFCPPTGKLGMFGDMEFAMILPEVNKREGMEICQAIREGVRNTVFAPFGKGELTFAIGLGENPIDGSTGEDIIRTARNNACQARQSGINK